ncbi:MAG: EAL domain-containing protein [Proteobacteria bacterium]|nr:EAL domain-containing protein [Pseudomonadota bacterium]
MINGVRQTVARGLAALGSDRFRSQMMVGGVSVLCLLAGLEVWRAYTDVAQTRSLLNTQVQTQAESHARVAQSFLSLAEKTARVVAVSEETQTTFGLNLTDPALEKTFTALNRQRLLLDMDALYLVDPTGLMRFRSLGAPNLSPVSLMTLLSKGRASGTQSFNGLVELQSGDGFVLVAAAPVYTPGIDRAHLGYVVTLPSLNNLSLTMDGQSMAWLAKAGNNMTVRFEKGRQTGLPMVLTRQENGVWQSAQGVVSVAPVSDDGWQLVQWSRAMQSPVRGGVLSTLPWTLATVAGVLVLLAMVHGLMRREKELETELAGPRADLDVNTLLLDGTDAGVIVLSSVGRIERMNLKALELFGGHVSDYQGAPAGKLFAKGVRPNTIGEETVMCKALHGGFFEARLRQDVGPNGTRILWMWDPDSEWAREAMAAEHQRNLEFLHVASEWQWEMDANGCFTWLSEDVELALGQPVEKLLHRFLGDMLLPVDMQRFSKNLLSIMATRQNFRNLLFRVADMNGEVEEFMLSGEPVYRDGSFAGFRGVATRTQEDRPEMHPAVTGRDMNTGLWTTAALEAALTRFYEQAHRTGNTAYLMQFLLREPDEQLTSSVREERLQAAITQLRPALQPDEVACVLEQGRILVLVQGEKGQNRVTRLRELRNLAQKGLQTLSDDLKISTGLVFLPRDAATSEEAIGRSAVAAETAREDGGDRIRMYDGTLNPGVLVTDPALTQIRQALEAGALELHFQPIIPIGQSVPAAFESFPYLAAKDGKLLRPSGYMPLIESGGGMAVMDTLAMQHLFERAANAMADNPRLAFSMNLSAATVHAERSIDMISELVRKVRINPGQIIFEIAEEVLLADTSRSRNFIRAVRRMGFRVTLDRFGSGVSALGLLRTFEVDFIKIDRGLIRDLDTSATARHMLRAVAGTAQSMGVAVIGCGVETEASYQYLRAAGIDFAQGYYLGRPVHNRIDVSVS